MFSNGPVDLGSVPGRVIPKTFKMALNTSLLNTQQYKVRIKGKVEQSRKGAAPSPTPRCSSYWKGNLRVALDYVRQLYLLFFIFGNKLIMEMIMMKEKKLYHFILDMTLYIKVYWHKFHVIFFYIIYFLRGSPLGAVVNSLDWDIVLNEFEPNFYVHNSERPGGTFKLGPAKFDEVPSASRTHMSLMGMNKQCNAQGSTKLHKYLIM